VTRLAPHERAEVREFLRATSPDLLRYFERRVDPRDDAADLLSETLLIAWKKVDGTTGWELNRRRTWIYTIAAHVLTNHRRTVRRRKSLADALRSTIRNTPQAPDDSEMGAVRDAVSRLPDSQRELVRLVHWDGLSLNEAAEVLGLNASTARSRYGVAKKSLREALSPDREPAEAVLDH
jgi:RNA polymerase sigma factor (sigma-70 family)